MLEIRNVTKVYRSKKGDQVKALDNVSVTFPASGMVFILGKSGSGKSTLLNVIGGLDSYDEGEFIIKGKSSKDFVGSDFDAYRNTFIGFIFQEYNILDDFSVGANIGLALELQGIKATPDKINAILEQVDLTDYAHRKPNELSGGQKQRVAIARALVKQPQIIMADEPTGALDSNTGKAIFDTLKALSREKLVLIVSHDRDFAERYADRIIELKDGQIISDVTKHEVAGAQLSEGVRRVGDRVLEIKGGYQLTTEDLTMINRYLAENGRGALLSGDERVNSELRSAAGISESGSINMFEETGAGDVPTEAYDGKTTKFIRSRLPAKNALKMGASGLKHKRFRLCFTIFLSLIAFALFGLADTMAAYDKITAATRSILDSNVTNASFQLLVKETSYYTDDKGKTHESYYYQEDNMNDQDVALLREKTGLDLVPVFTGSLYGGGGSSLQSNMAAYSNDAAAYDARLHGFVSMSAEALSSAGLSVTGRLPATDDEIAVSKFMFDQFNQYGFSNAAHGESVRAGSLTLDESATGLLGKHIRLTGNIRRADGTDYEYVVVGVIDTQFDRERYEKFLPSDDNSGGASNITDYLLQMELQETLDYGLHALGFVTSGAIADMAANNTEPARTQNLGINTGSMSVVVGRKDPDTNNLYNYASFSYVANNGDLEGLPVTWFDGTPRTSLGDKEYVVGRDVYLRILAESASQNLSAEHYRDLSREILLSAGTDENRFGWNDDAAYCLLQYEAIRAAYQGDLLSNTALVNDLCQSWSISEADWDARTDVDQKADVANYYCNYLQSSRPNYGGGATANRYVPARDLVTIFREALTAADMPNIYIRTWDNSGSNIDLAVYSDWTPVGMYDDTLYSGDCIVSEALYNYVDNANRERGYNVSRTVRAKHAPGIWAFAVAPMPKSSSEVERLVSISYYGFDGADFKSMTKKERAALTDPDLSYTLKNQVMQTLDNFNSFIEIGATVFLWVGVGFAVFSGLLLMNFISISISYKKREIGILRAVGARSSDVFKIFFSESLIIALINYVLAVAATLTAIFFINRWMRGEGINITLLNFGLRQLGLMLAVSVGVALLASFLPVWRIARKKPVDAIKDR